MLIRSLAGLLAVSMVAALFVGGAQPQAAGLVPAPWDKLAHVAYFFVFAVLLARFVGLPVTLVLVLGLAVGAMDELHQTMLPGRFGDWDDWLADALGTVVGVVGAALTRAKGPSSPQPCVMSSTDSGPAEL